VPVQRLADALGVTTVQAAALLARAEVQGLPGPDRAFVERLLGRSQDQDELAALCLDDLLLAHHAMHGQRAALAMLRSILDRLRAPLRRTGATVDQIDLLLDDLPALLVAPRDELPPRLVGYSGRGRLAAWIRVVAVRTLVERMKSAPLANDEAAAELAAPELDPELLLLRRQYAAEFAVAFRTVIGELPPADRLLLRQHHLEGIGIDRLAAQHGIHRATAARRIAAVRELVFERVRRHLLATLRIGGDTFDSLVRIVRTELELGLDHYL
jgi:RNA polymerase sigma-70 factor (ECF subfamily)